MLNMRLYRSVVIIGGGESGVGAAVLAQQKGYDVFLSEGKKITEERKNMLNAYCVVFEEGNHSIDKILAADIIIKSPGLSEKTELMKTIRKENKLVMSEIEFAYQFVKDKFIVAITGSNGKSTTTSLIYHIFKQSGKNAALVGNIGKSFAYQIATDPVDNYIVEVSSFQLDDIIDFKPNIAVLLNITEDHLDQYNYEFIRYIKSKFNIIKNQTNEDFFIYNADDEVINNYISSINIFSQVIPFSMTKNLLQGVFLYKNMFTHKHNDTEITTEVEENISLRGKHNQYNTMAAFAAANAAKIQKEHVRDALKTFMGLNHRMEFVRQFKGVDFINDSKATNINSTWFALQSMNKKTILILGGIDKGNDYNMLIDLVKEKVRAIVCLGIDNKKIIEAFQDIVPVVETRSMEECIKKTLTHAVEGDVVLLSPACASFDLFNNYEDRGNQFKTQAYSLF